jgi:hypothetical protein
MKNARYICKFINWVGLILLKKNFRSDFYPNIIALEKTQL